MDGGHKDGFATKGTKVSETRDASNPPVSLVAFVATVLSVSSWRRGPWSELMKPIVDRMSVQDMTNLSAYTASLDPAGGRPARAGTR